MAAGASANGGPGTQDTCPRNHDPHDCRRGTHCPIPNVRDLLINNGLPLKFNRTSISGGRRGCGAVRGCPPCATRISKNSSLFGVGHYRNCNRLGEGGGRTAAVTAGHRTTID